VLNVSTDLGSACEVIVEIINGIETVSYRPTDFMSFVTKHFPFLFVIVMCLLTFHVV